MFQNYMDRKELNNFEMSKEYMRDKRMGIHWRGDEDANGDFVLIARLWLI